MLMAGLYLLAINLLTGFLFYLDKQKAELGTWRIPENTLLGFALLGGSIGAKWAQRKFRHKTRKHPFAFTLNTILVVQLILVALLIVPQTNLLLTTPR